MSLWRRLVAFFQSAFGAVPRLPVLEDASPEQAEETPEPFELDVERLNYIQFRRRLLDWRDEFAVQMLAEGSELFRQFSEHVEKKLEDESWFRQLFAKPAAEVLEDDFYALFRSPLIQRIQAAEDRLSEIIEGHTNIQSPTSLLGVGEVDPSLFTLEDIKFRPANLAIILQKINHIAFGEYGVIDCYLRCAQDISRNLLQEKDAS